MDSARDRRLRAVIKAAPSAWGVRPPVIVGLGGLAIVFAAWLVFAGSPSDRVVAGAGVVLAALGAALLSTMRRRLTADADGFTVRGPSRVRRIGWGQVAAIAAPTRRRRGLTSASLELDLDDDGLILFGRIELGADPAEVAIELRRLWRPAPGTD